jgi:hypothetical protein
VGAAPEHVSRLAAEVLRLPELRRRPLIVTEPVAVKAPPASVTPNGLIICMLRTLRIPGISGPVVITPVEKE